MTVTKTVDLSGSSSESIQAAIEHAISRAALTIADIESFEVVRIAGTVSAGAVASYRVELRVTFVVKEVLHE